MKNTPLLITSSLVLSMASLVYGEDKPGSATAAAPAPPAKPSAGLVNDWLRKESHFFNPWDFGGQGRIRYEAKENGGVAPTTDFRKTGVDNDNAYLLIRATVHLGYNTPWISAYAEGRESSSTGDDRDPNPESNLFDLHQGYLVLGNAAKFPLTLKAGRQEMTYGDERLIGNADWGNIGRSFDAARLRYEDKNFWVDAFSGRVVLPNDGQFDQVNDYDWFSGIYASTRTLVPRQETQLYFLSRNVNPKSANEQLTTSLVRPASGRDIYTLGARVRSLPGQWHGWDYGAEIAGQLGSIKAGGPTSRRLDQEAWAASASGGYTWTEVSLTPRLGLEYNFASGDNDPTDDTSGTFDQLFPTNHKHYGTMDFVAWKNIHNPRFMAQIKPHKKLTVALDYHLYWLADTHDFFYAEGGASRNGGGYGINPGFSSFVGSEIDLDATYTPFPYAGLRAGYGHFFTGGYVDRSLQGVGGSRDSDWVYIQATLNF